MYQLRPTQNENVVIYVGDIRSEIHNLINSPSKLPIIYTHSITEPENLYPFNTGVLLNIQEICLNELANKADFFGLALFWVLEDDVVNFSGEYHSGRQNWSRTLRDWGRVGLN